MYTHAKGRSACLCVLACGRHLFLSLCVYVQHRRKGSDVYRRVDRRMVGVEEFWTWAACTSGMARGARGGKGIGGVVGRVLMSYVCDAETPKLAHAIVYIYVYPL